MKHLLSSFLRYSLFRGKKAKFRKKLVIQTFNPSNFIVAVHAIERLYFFICSNMLAQVRMKILYKLCNLYRIIHVEKSDNISENLYLYFKMLNIKYMDLSPTDAESISTCFSIRLCNRNMGDSFHEIYRHYTQCIILIHLLNNVRVRLHCPRISILPIKKKIMTVLRSPHTDKKSREQFALVEHKKVITIPAYIAENTLNILFKYFEFYTKLSYKTCTSR